MFECIIIFLDLLLSTQPLCYKLSSTHTTHTHCSLPALAYECWPPTKKKTVCDTRTACTLYLFIVHNRLPVLYVEARRCSQSSGCLWSVLFYLWRARCEWRWYARKFYCSRQTKRWTLELDVCCKCCRRRLLFALVAQMMLKLDDVSTGTKQTSTTSEMHCFSANRCT